MKLDVLHQTVGKTRTGKIVFCASDPNHIPLILDYFSEASYSADDLLDAHAIFEYLSVYALRRNDSFADLYAQHSEEIFKSTSSVDYESSRCRVF